MYLNIGVGASFEELQEYGATWRGKKNGTY
jgi:hypothetical protein